MSINIFLQNSISQAKKQSGEGGGRRKSHKHTHIDLLKGWVNMFDSWLSET